MRLILGKTCWRSEPWLFLWHYCYKKVYTSRGGIAPGIASEILWKKFSFYESWCGISSHFGQIFYIASNQPANFKYVLLLLILSCPCDKNIIYTKQLQRFCQRFWDFSYDFEIFGGFLDSFSGFFDFSNDVRFFPELFRNIFWDLWIFSGTFFKLCTDFFELFPGRFCSFHFTVSDYMRNSEALNPKRFIQILSLYWYVFEF